MSLLLEIPEDQQILPLLGVRRWVPHQPMALYTSLSMDVETIFHSWPVFATACAVMLLAELIYVLFGFGAGLVAVGVLALIMPDVRDIVVLLLLVNLPVELSVVGPAWRDIRWRAIGVVCLGIAVGVPLGTLILRWGEPTLLLTLLGGVLVVAGSVFLAVPRGRPIRWRPWSAAPVGLVSGVLAGLFGTGGPPLVLYYQLSGTAKTVFRNSLMAIFLVVTLVRVPSYLASGLITWPRFFSALAVAPAVALGAWLGHRIHLEVSEVAFRKLVSTALVAIGGLLLARQLL